MTSGESQRRYMERKRRARGVLPRGSLSAGNFLCKILLGSGGCWIWTGKKNNNGYGMGYLFGKPGLAHRLMWKLVYGKLPGKHLLHSCDNPACVNPDHLREGTPKENALDAKSRGRLRHQKMGVCKHGHPRSDTRTWFGPNGRVEHICKTCERNRMLKYRRNRGKKEE